MPRWVTRLQLLVFWTKFSGRTFPSSQRRGVRDIKKMNPFRFTADGVVSSAPASKASRTDHYYGFALSRSRFAPVCAAFVASRHFLDGAATPPLRGGEYDAFKFRPNSNIIDIWLRRSRAKPLVVCSRMFTWPAGMVWRTSHYRSQRSAVLRSTERFRGRPARGRSIETVS